MKGEEGGELLIVEWEDKYAVGIPLIDGQHKELIEHTNKLYQGCMVGDEEAKKAYFMKAVKSVVDYVNYHFSAEEKMLENIKYPGLAEHKKQHESFVKKLLDDVKGYEEGWKFAPNSFVRFLRDWILSHIAMEDTKYARYIQDLKKNGRLGGR
ncbi:MAG: bacteriohemerythrin [Treponema sp.]|jgi:hemerythrin|nr:bacteriohemerythrin [Treponema sp.]